MKTKGLLLLMLISLLPCARLLAQTIGPPPGVVCPGEEKPYVLDTQTTCSFVWTVTNGTFSGGGTTLTTSSKTVNVTWDDKAETGTLSVKCGSTTLATTQYAINSLINQNLTNARTTQILGYCSTISTIAQVDRMYVPSTLVTNGVNQKIVDGYEWTLPSGWSSDGRTGTFQTPYESITITPSNGCVGGSIKVKGFVHCAVDKYSNEASISVDRISVGNSIGVQSGYTGARCGDTSPVTFTAASIACAANYRWTATATGWTDVNGAPGPWTTLGNTITLYPKGNSTDQGVISVDISLGCGTLTQTRTITYSDPALPTPVIQTSSVSMLCSLGSGTVSIAPVAGAQSYTWYSQSTGTVYINGAAHPNGSALTTTGTSVTVSLPSLTSTTGYRTDIYVSAVNKPGCAGSAVVASRKVWAGIPSAGGALDISLNPTCVGQIKLGTFSTPADGFSSMTQIPDPFQYADIYPSTTYISFEALQATPPSTSFTLRYTNSCGVKDRKYAIVIYDSFDPRCGGGGGGGALKTASNQMASIFPNPTSETLVVTYEGDLTQNDPKLTLFDDQQNIVYQSAIKARESAINVSKLKKGIYYLRINGGEGNEEHRVVIEK
jgi:hypothetical protein